MGGPPHSKEVGRSTCPPAAILAVPNAGPDVPPPPSPGGLPLLLGASLVGWSLPVAPTREEGAPQSLCTGPRGTSLHSPPPPQGMSPAWWGPWGAGPQAEMGRVSRNQESASSPSPHHGSPVAPWAFAGPWPSHGRIWDPSWVSKEQVAPGPLSLVSERTGGGEGPWTLRSPRP